LGFATLTTNLRAEQTTTIEFQIESQRNKKKSPEYHHPPTFFCKEFGGEPRTGSRQSEDGSRNSLSPAAIWYKAKSPLVTESPSHQNPKPSKTGRLVVREANPQHRHNRYFSDL
jgi:hypothetical protein